MIRDEESFKIIICAYLDKYLELKELNKSDINLKIESLIQYLKINLFDYNIYLKNYFEDLKLLSKLPINRYKQKLEIFEKIFINENFR